MMIPMWRGGSITSASAAAPRSHLHHFGFFALCQRVDASDVRVGQLLQPLLGAARRILGNLARVVPDGLEAHVDWDAWERPPVFEWLADRGVSEEELRRVFNLGIGYCAIVKEPPAGANVIGEIA